MASDDTHARSGTETVNESVAHYQVEKLADGRVKVSSGGHVTIAATYYEALENFAKREQERIEESPDHLRERHLESISHDCTNPELEDVIANDAESIKEEVIEDVLEGGEMCRSGAWLALREEADVPDLGDKICVYRKWGTEWGVDHE